MTEVIREPRVRTADAALRARARAVIPGGMYGHLSANALSPEYPQFYERAQGAHVWDVDGNEYVDFMCSFGPVLLGHNHPAVGAAAAAQRAKGDTMSGPGAAMVEAAEVLDSRVEHADWAMFAKNGTDATTIALMVARAATGRSKVLAAKGAYHGGSPWFTPRDAGVAAEDRANFRYYTFNDLISVEKALANVGTEDVAGIIVSPYRHDAGFDQELTDAEFARGLRALCDRIGAALIMDEVRGGFRLHDGGSWEPIGVRARPECVEQGDRQRVPAGRDPGRRALGGRGVPDLRHRLVLVPGRAARRLRGHAQRGPGRRRRRDDGRDGHAAPRGAGSRGRRRGGRRQPDGPGPDAEPLFY